jgi:regulation of enolase protein 1 (concanavalin A-like superfamily)
MRTRLILFVSLAVVLGLMQNSPVLGFSGGVDPSMAGWWTFDEMEGSVAKDSSGNGNDGTLSTNPPTWVVGKIAGALQFNGSNTEVQAPHIPLNGRSFTVAMWVNPVLTASAIIFSQPQSGSTNLSLHFRLGAPSSSDAPVRGIRMGFYSNDVDSPTGLIQDNTWYHLTFVYDYDNGRVQRIFVNGEQVAQRTGADPFAATSGATVIGSWSGSQYFNGMIDDVRVYQKPLAVDEIATVMAGNTRPIANNPAPKSKATDVPRDVVLGWGVGPFAKTHDVYFGTVFDDVNTASRTDSRGLLVSQGQASTSLDPAGLLAFAQTYYWRVDEVNAAPDSTIFKGDTWSFTAEPYGYPVRPTKATASSSMAATMGPEKTIDGSGLDSLDQHGNSATTMWTSKKNQTPIWIQYEFDKAYKLYQMWVWNSNQAVESVVGFGAKDVTVETSLDGITWTALGNFEFAQATGEPNYVHNTTVDFAGVDAKFVKLTIADNWADGTKQASLSEVRFFYVPVSAFGPAPVSGATDVAVDAVLNWRPGRLAAQHQVYVSADANAVANGTVPAKTVTDHSLALAPLALDYGKTYYWKVNEVNDALATKSFDGDVWSFTTIGYAVVEDFESYNDVCNRIFFSWIDGFGHNGSPDCGIAPSNGNATGSTVGNVNPPFAEKTLVHGGGQSMPMAFDNTKSPFYSEAQREFTQPQAWTGNGVKNLVAFVRGEAPAFLETSPGTILMNGAGTDVWNASDQFRLVYKSLKGNGSIVAKVESLEATNEWSKAGVMIRETVSGGSTHAFNAATPTATHGISFQRRTTVDVATNANQDVNATPLPQWVKLTRNGSTFTAQYSSDGKAWKDVVTTAPVTIDMANDVLIGLAVCSHVAGTAAGAKFSNVSTTGSVSGAWQVAEIGATQLGGNTPESFYLAVQDSAGKTKVLTHPDNQVIALGPWQQWTIPLSEFSSAGLNLNSIKKILVGVGDRSSPKTGGAGTIQVDDIRLTP